VWDTVRRDHLSVYGYERETTPFLKQWAAGARVYNNCITPASTTMPSHASMFTGRHHSEHGVSNAHPQLDRQYNTVAELLKSAGYDTYMFAANPHLVASKLFTQGFDIVEHPWSPKYLVDARRIVLDKIDPADQSNELAIKVNTRSAEAQMSDWDIKTAGTLAQRGVLEWMGSLPGGNPYFIFINYMEAHRPLIPRRKYRAAFMTAEEIDQSLRVDRSWGKTWAYVMNEDEYLDEEIDLTRKTYDACLLELDHLFRDLIQAMEAHGSLENTIVILTSDHGEHLGEHHMLDHQFSVYNELLHVPLIVHYPAKFAPGTDDSPVMNFDLFPTLLKLAGARVPSDCTQAIDLGETPETRLRMAEYPMWIEGPINATLRHNRFFDPTPWKRRLRAMYDEENLKLVCGSDGRHELYDTQVDERERRDLARLQPELVAKLHQRLTGYLGILCPPGEREKLAEMTDVQRRRLESLGYVGTSSGSDVGAADYCLEAAK
jgi:arylsulfatase A-like enzyme